MFDFEVPRDGSDDSIVGANVPGHYSSRTVPDLPPIQFPRVRVGPPPATTP